MASEGAPPNDTLHLTRPATLFSGCPWLSDGGRDVGSLGSFPYENSHEDYIMTKKLKKVHEPVAERDPEDKPKVVEVHDRNPLFDAGRRVVLASVGAVALASDEFKNLVNKLIERGEIVENRRPQTAQGNDRTYAGTDEAGRDENGRRSQVSTVR